jgi:hypothetical protein
MNCDHVGYTWCSLFNELKKRHTGKYPSSHSSIRNNPIDLSWAPWKNKVYSQIPTIYDNQTQINTLSFWQKNWTGICLLFELWGLFVTHSIYLLKSHKEFISITLRRSKLPSVCAYECPIFWINLNHPIFCTFGLLRACDSIWRL